MIPWLENHMPFPPPHKALDDPDGLLAAGGDLSPNRLLEAYRNGIFPWYNVGEPILWWSPNPRCVIFPKDIHLSRSLRKAFRKTPVTLTFDQCFEDVIDRCSEPRADGEGTWISPAMKYAYGNLHRLGHAHSVEVWSDGELIGGLYGLAIGPFFFGESMFSRAPNGSKFAIYALATQLQRWNYQLIDCQITNPHLLSMGAREITRSSFITKLHKEISQPVDHSWSFEPDLLNSIYR